MDEDFANPRLMQANVAFEWELARQMTLCRYVPSRGRGGPSPLDRPQYRTAGREDRHDRRHESHGESPILRGNRPFTNFQRVVAFESSAESRYHGLTLELNRRLTGNLFFRVAYTVGKVEDTAPDATAVLVGNMQDDAKFASNPVDFEADRAAGNNDQRHRFVASGGYGTDRLANRLGGIGRALASGWWFSGIVTVQSGHPYSARVNGDLNGDGNGRNDFAPGTRRNAFRLPPIVTFDPRIARDFPVAGRVHAQLIVEAFNLFNRDNINAVAPFSTLWRERR